MYDIFVVPNLEKKLTSKLHVKISFNNFLKFKTIVLNIEILKKNEKFSNFTLIDWN